MKQIACSNCGAKYKLPDSFKNDKAKCKACGSVIDVAGQLAGGDGGKSTASSSASSQPAKAKPAKAKPATARRSASSADSKSASPRRASASRKAGSDDGEGDSSRSASKTRSRDRVRGAGRTTKAEKKSGGKGMLIGGGLLALAVIVVGLVMFLNDDEKPNTDPQTAANEKNTGSATDGGNTKPASADESDPLDGATPDLDDATPSVSDANPAEASGAGEGAAAADAVATKPKKKSKSSVPTSKDEVYDPKVELQELPFPEDMDEEAIAMAKELVDEVCSGGIVGVRAKAKLAEMNYQAIPAIVNRMRGFDFFDADDNALAFDFTRMLRTMTKQRYGVPAETVEYGEDVPLEKAHVNAKSVMHWHKVAVKLNSEAAWTKFLDRADKKGK